MRHLRGLTLGMFPGPTVEARPGDTVIINVINAMNEETSIHWHGIRQFSKFHVLTRTS